MYDSLVLRKRYRPATNDYSLDFPTTDVCQLSNSNVIENNNKNNATEQSCCKTKLVTTYLDGDDPMYQQQQEQLQSLDNMVMVPMNGLLDRLENYEKRGVVIDSRVYAFAIGIKTAERFVSTSSEREIQEAPQI